MRELLEEPDSAERAAALAGVLVGLPGGPPGIVADLVLASTGPFARLARAGLDPGDPRLDLAARELDILGALAHSRLEPALGRHGLADAVTAADASPADAPPAAAALRGELLEDSRWGALACALADHHRCEGTGALAVHRVLRFREGALAAVERPDRTRLADLIGGDALRASLLADLEAFVTGAPANDALLYGPPGTGKSVTVRAAAAAFTDRGLRLVQVDREDVARLEDVLALLAGDGPRCLVMLDDLVFDDAGRADRALRTALDGGVSERPANVLVWATSNRLRLLHETHAEREADVEGAAGRAEKVALATRFGRRVAFAAPDQEGYLAVAEGLLRARLGAVPPGSREAALRFARLAHGMTPRTARQFAAAYRPTPPSPS
jgi:predicted AAA+ superfamily ATPase